MSGAYGRGNAIADRSDLDPYRRQVFVVVIGKLQPTKRESNIKRHRSLTNAIQSSIFIIFHITTNSNMQSIGSNRTQNKLSGRFYKSVEATQYLN